MALLTLPELPYAKDALGFISEKTLSFHHDKHFKTYVDTANKLIEGTEFAGMPLMGILATAKGALFNNVSQAYNHDFYFKCLSPEKQDIPEKVAAALNSAFGSAEKFKEEFIKNAAGNFGSGWTWLVEDNDRKVRIFSTSNAGNPLSSGLKPLLVVDVWEHAYYLDYQNRRADYLKDFAEHINWGFVAENLV
ncbi:MAG: superoxide dismutase [Succinivibrio sp.]|jgi:Fe-Mn family superoxide dismutase|nr:superoxide dismutase [Succinivibrio sp.]